MAGAFGHLARFVQCAVNSLFIISGEILKADMTNCGNKAQPTPVPYHLLSRTEFKLLPRGLNGCCFSFPMT